MNKLKSPTVQFMELYDAQLSKSISARSAYEKASRIFTDKHDYELYGSYYVFKSALSRYRRTNRLTMLTT